MEGDSPNASLFTKVHCGPINTHLLSVFFPSGGTVTTTQMLFETEKNVHC